MVGRLVVGTRMKLTLLVSVLTLAVVGCGEKVEPETQASKTEAASAGSGWSKEQIDAFKQAHINARSGKEGK